MNDAKQRLLLGISLILFIVLLLSQGISWLHDSVTLWENKAKTQATIKQEVATLAERLKASHGVGKNSKAQNHSDPIDSLLPWLEKETSTFQLTDKMQQIAPVAIKSNETNLYREKADLNLKAIPISTAIRFLNRLESTTQIRIVRGDIKRGENEATGVNLSLEVGLL